MKEDRFITSFSLQFKRLLINPLVPVSSVNLQNYMQSKNALSVIHQNAKLRFERADLV